MIEYPKIETLYDRNPENMKEIVLGKYRLPEFEMLKDAPIWHLTEKIDGTNIRVMYDGGIESGEGRVRFYGRTDNAQIPTFLLGMLQERFTPKVFENAFDLCGPGASTFVCTLYGEGYGPKIQSGGWYRNDVAFRVFDVRIGDWWLNWPDVRDVACKLGVQTVPVLDERATIAEALLSVQRNSVVACIEGGTDRYHEGIIARTNPLLLTRDGKRLMWKLKVRDLPK